MKRKIVYVVIAILIIGSAFSLCSCGYTGSETGAETESSYDEGYDDGYDNGYDEGYEIGYDEGYDEGYNAACEINSSDGYYDPDASNEDFSSYPSGEVYTFDNAPAGSVWATPHGEKYHEAGCQYVNNRYDLKLYYSSQDAMNDGLTPCSVCH